MSDCEKHPLEESQRCARCGKNACAACGVFYIDDAIACRACGEALVSGAGLPLGTLLIAALYLSMVATLAATGRLKPAFLGGAALLAIALARVFAVNRDLRRPLVTRLVATDEPMANVRVSDVKVTTSSVPVPEPASSSALAEPTRAEPTRAEPTRAEPTRAEPTRAEPTRAEPTPAEPTPAEPTPAEPTPAESSTASPAEKEAP